MTLRVLLASLLLAGVPACGGSRVDPSPAAADTSSDQTAGTGDDGASPVEVNAPPAPLVLPPSCDSDTDAPPRQLVCTGLYADIEGKQTAPGVAPYAPAIPLWSDGAEKQRWILLPAGGVIDNTDPGEWSFPVGTKVWKEFSRGGQRVETRLWQKIHDGYWVNATYAWDADESGATLSSGGDITLADGTTYHVPTNDECQKCHRGRTDRILGFEQVLLGLPGAVGLTLEALVAQGQLSDPPASTSLTIGDDGTGAAAAALGWLHVNCGTTCHNANSGSSAFAAGMLLRLDPNQLDGRPVNDFEALKTTLGVVVGTPNWSGQIRIVPGSPDQSLIYQLISHRGTGSQMPPIATDLVDELDIPLVAGWIAAMPPVSALQAPGGTDPGSSNQGGTPDVADPTLAGGGAPPTPSENPGPPGQ